MKRESVAYNLSQVCAVAILALGSPLGQAAGLVDLYRESIANDPAYAAARADRDAVETLVPQARGQLLPQVSLITHATRTIPTMNFGQGKAVSAGITTTTPVMARSISPRHSFARKPG